MGKPTGKGTRRPGRAPAPSANGDGDEEEELAKKTTPKSKLKRTAKRTLKSE